MKDKKILVTLFAILILVAYMLLAGNGEMEPSDSYDSTVFEDEEEVEKVELDSDNILGDKDTSSYEDEKDMEKEMYSEEILGSKDNAIEKDTDNFTQEETNQLNEEKDEVNKENQESKEEPNKDIVEENAEKLEKDKEKIIEEQKAYKEKLIEEDNKNMDKKDKYLTDPVPEGKPEPVEWQDVTINKDKVLTCTLSVTCKTIFDNMEMFNKDKLEVLPEDGVIFPEQEVIFYEGESVFDVLLREMQKNNIHMEFEMVPIYNSNYVEGINNIYEFDCGELSGWMYRVNGWFPNYGSSRYQLKDGDVVEWIYTCDLGRDIGGGFYDDVGGEEDER